MVPCAAAVQSGLPQTHSDPTPSLCSEKGVVIWSFCWGWLVCYVIVGIAARTHMEVALVAVGMGAGAGPCVGAGAAVKHDRPSKDRFTNAKTIDAQ